MGEKYTSKDIKAEESRMQDYWRGAEDNGVDTVRDAKIRGYENLRDFAENHVPSEAPRLDAIVRVLKKE